MTSLQQKLNQLSLTTMSNQLDQIVAEALALSIFPRAWRSLRA